MLPDWIELCRLFSAQRVEFLLIGGDGFFHDAPKAKSSAVVLVVGLVGAAGGAACSSTAIVPLSYGFLF